MPIACRGLTKYYDRAIGVEGLDLSVAAGSVMGFLGPNGAGKTTVIRMLVGLLLPTSGSALLWGRPARDAEARRALGYMPADPAFYPALTGTENLDLLASIQGAPSADREWAIDLLGLSRSVLGRPVRSYSSGMVQKLALVQAVQHRPSVLILDEPANRLDPLAHRSFEEMVRRVAADGRTVLLSSHTLSEVEDVCDKVALLRAGRLLAVQSVGSLSAAAPRWVHAHYRVPPLSLPDALIDPVLSGDRLDARMPAGAIGALRELLADEHLVDLTVEPGSLEETFVHLYRDGADPDNTAKPSP